MPPALAASGLDLNLDASTAAITVGPGCALPAAVTAGAARVSGDLYLVPGGGSAVTCYHQANDAALVELSRPNGATTIVLGSASTLSNAELGQQGDAALALGVLNTRAVQWVPGGLGAGPAPPSRRGLLNLLPPRLLWATLQLFLAVVVLALWRARRLGRPVVEPLPVVVRAAETVEGAGRMLHAAHARDCGVGVAAHGKRHPAVAGAAARSGRRASGRHHAGRPPRRTSRPEVAEVLYGGEPRDDTALVRLARELPRLEAEVAAEDAPGEGGQQ